MKKALLLIITSHILSFPIWGQQSSDTILLDTAHIIIPNLYSNTKITPHTSLTGIYVLNHHQLENKNATQIADILQNIPSVTLKDYGGVGGLKTISVRSLGASHTKVLLDGIPINNTETGQIDLSKFPIENIASIALINHQLNAPLQTAQAYAGGSILNIISTSEFPLFKERNKLSTSLQYASFNFFKSSIDWMFQLDSSSFFSIYGHTQNTHGRFPFSFQNGEITENMTRENADVFQGQSIINYGKSWKKRNIKLRSKAFFNSSERGLPGAVVLYNPSTGARLWDKNFFTQNKIEKIFQKWEGKWLSKYNYSYKKYVNPNFLNTENKIEDKYTQQSIYNSIAIKYTFKKNWTFFYSSDHDYSTLSTNILEHPSPRRNTFLNVLGSNFSFSKIKLETNILSTIIQEKTGIDSRLKHRVTPSISVGYKPLWHRNFRLRFSYKNVYRYPTFNDLYYVRVGNVNLRPELASQWNAGINYIFKGMKMFFLQKMEFRSDVFWYEVKDKIVAVPTQNLFIWSMQNFGRVQTKGFELYTDIYFKDYKKIFVDVNLGYSFQEALDKTNSNSSTYNQQIIYIPFETGSAHININRKKWTISSNYTYTGHRFFLPENKIENLLSAWHLLDWGIQYKLITKKHTWRIKGEINNILNTDYQIIINYPMPKRNYRLSIFFDL